jgi:hypothetical protein
MIRLDARGLSASLRHLESEIEVMAQEVVRQTAEYAAGIARQTSAFRDGPRSRLRSSIIHVEKDAFHHVVQAGSAEVPYAVFAEEGTRAHTIEARRAKVLRFVVAGERRFVRRVNHPGTKATHFMRDARDQAEAAVARFVGAGARHL